MADVLLLRSEVPKYANIIYKKVAVLNVATAGALGSDTNGVLIHTFGAFGGIVAGLKISTDDTAAVNVFLYSKNGTDIIPEGIVNVPLNSGNLGTAANVDVLAGSGVRPLGDWIEQNGKRVIPCQALHDFKVSVLANMTSGKKCYVTALIYEYSDTVG